jgi:hypothetical protein
MNSIIKQTSDRIRSGVAELEDLIHRIKEGWVRAERSGDAYYLDGVALNLHGLYCGLERLFEIIAANVDGIMSAGENWHCELLEQIAKEIPKIRPAVISNASFSALNELRGFRHIVRNVYAFNFDPSKMHKLVKNAPILFSNVSAELIAFADFLEDTV